MTRTSLPGTARQNQGRMVQNLDPDLRVFANILVRRNRGINPLKQHVINVINGRIPHLTHDDFNTQFGIHQDDHDAVVAFAKSNNLSVSDVDHGSRTIKVHGTVASMNTAFGIDLAYFNDKDGTQYVSYTRDISLPSTLGGVIEHVHGLDTKKTAKPYIKYNDTPNATAVASPNGYKPQQLATAYNFPPGTGAGQCVAIIELGGGFTTTDLTEYFTAIGVHPAPNVVAVPVAGATNTPAGDPNSADGEVMLDIEVAGGIAPGAKFAVYFAPNTSAGFLEGINAAIHDTINKPSVISISWGMPEINWSPADMTAFDDAFQAAVALGITVTVAAGDNGSADDSQGNNADFPSSSPHVLSCGGTRLTLSGANMRVAETVWNDGTNGGATGGGISSYFLTPSWQSGLSAALTTGGHTMLTHRGVPDIAANADPVTGYMVCVDGVETVVGGTSAVAPLMAGLFARINANKGKRYGFANQLFYANKTDFNDVTVGNNGTYAANPGWDAASGLGAPIGANLQTIGMPNVPPTHTVIPIPTKVPVKP